MLPVLQTAIVTAFDERCSLRTLIPLLVTVADVPLLNSAVFSGDPKSPLLRGVRR